MAYRKRDHATVYQITNLVTGDFYIGITQFTPENRWVEHKWNALNGKRTHFYNAVRKYGVDRFSIHPIATALRLEDWSVVERLVIADRNPHYNQTNGGEITKGRRISIEVKERIRAGNLGKKRTPEQNAALGLRTKARLQNDPVYRQRVLAALERARANPETERKRLEAIRRPHGRKPAAWITARMLAGAPKRWEERKQPIECTTLNCTFDSMKEAAEFCGLKQSHLSNVVAGRCRSSLGLEFCRIEKDLSDVS